MRAEADSKTTADNLIHWIREYTPLHIDSYLSDEQGNYPPHVFLDLGNQGFFGMHISRQYGGLELKTSDMLRVIEQVAAIDLTLAVILIESIQGAHTVEKYASKSMKNRYLHQMATGRVLTAGAMTESAAGSNPRAMKSVAISDNNKEWLIRGSKRWVGMGSSASIIAIYVQQYDSNNHWLGMSGFLVPQGTKGLRIGPAASTMGIRGFPKNIVYMDDIRVSSEYLLGKPGEGMEIAQDNMMYIRLCLAVASIGAMKRCVQLMLRYAERRMIATGQLIENPVTLVRLSEMTAIIKALENFIYLISNLYDKNPTVVPEEAFVISKVLSSEYMGWMVDLLVQMLGARGYEEASGVSKMFRDARVFRIFEGPTEALNMYVGSRALSTNLCLDNFISKTLKQSDFYKEINQTISQINESCLLNKRDLFAKPFSINYWAQSIVGEIISYGLLLSAIEYQLMQCQSETLQRAAIWVRDKYEDVRQKAVTFSRGEKVTVSATELKRCIADYSDTIGNVEQPSVSPHRSIDKLLTTHYVADENDDYLRIKHDLFAKLPGITTHVKKDLITEVGSSNLLNQSLNNENKINIPQLCTHHLFEEQVNRTPMAIAVVYQDKQITYEELNKKANKVAHYLRQQGVEGNKLVGIHLERSIEMIIGLLGILKAGGAYLPLDYNYPEKSLRFMVEDSQAHIILSQKKLAEDIPFETEKVVFIEDVLKKSTKKQDNLMNSVDVNHLGYVIYTSGSTGHPKGVMVPHRALANLIIWHREKIQAKRNVLQFTTLNFDMSFIEIFSALTAGGTLILISEKDRLDHLSFAKVVKNNQVEQLVISVPFLKSLAEAKIEKEYFKSVKEIIIAGEQLIITPAILSFFNHLNSCKLLNYYGPSETHVVSAYEFPQKITDWPDYPPIGQVIPNNKVLILDDHKKPVPFGSSGEIYIGGVSLAEGYMHRSELTHERFIPDPWSSNPTARLYKTGDYGRYLPDGNLIYLGRKDEQVKIRGFRIEPQEIEWHLIKYPGVKEAVVIAKKGLSAEKHLEAFLVINGDINDNFINDIYSFLQESLPPHMHPSVLNIIDAMPLTNSGKINRNALENYERSIVYSIHQVVEPKTLTEKEMITVMEDVFQLQIGINSSFMSIGGNSLLAMHIVSKLRDKFSVEVPAYTLLSDPTLADTAKRIDQLLSKRN